MNNKKIPLYGCLSCLTPDALMTLSTDGLCQSCLDKYEFIETKPINTKEMHHIFGVPFDMRKSSSKIKIEHYPHVEVFIQKYKLLVQSKYTYTKDGKTIEDIIHEIEIPANLDIQVILRICKFVLDDCLLTYGALSTGGFLYHKEGRYCDFILIDNVTLENWESFSILLVDYIAKYNKWS
jgi:hypothetical protein